MAESKMSKHLFDWQGKRIIQLEGENWQLRETNRELVEEVKVLKLFIDKWMGSI